MQTSPIKAGYMERREKKLKERIKLWKRCIVACVMIFCLGITAGITNSHAAEYEEKSADDDGS